MEIERNASAREGSSDLTTYLSLLLVQFLWAATFVVGKMAVLSVSPEVVILGRYVLTSLMFAAAMILQHSPKPAMATARPTARGIAALLGMALFGTVFYNLFLLYSFSYTTAVSASLLIPTTQPIFTAILSCLFLDEERPRSLPTVLALGLAGACLVLFSDPGGANATALQGYGLVLLSSLSFSIFIIFTKLSLRSFSSFSCTAYSTLLATASLVPLTFAVVDVQTVWEQIGQSQYWSYILFLAIFGTVIPYLLWNRGVKLLGASRTAVITFALPPAAVLLSSVFLAESVSPLQLVGTTLIMCAVYINMRRR